MEYQPGEIVLIKFPFSNSKGYKKRPALVLQSFSDGDLILCRVTSKRYRTDYDLNVIDWENCGLLLPSVIRVHKLITLESTLIEGKLGAISAQLLEEVSRVFLGILSLK